jgi:sec-independent protein translocase protein TatA
MGSLSIWHWLLVIGIAVLLFGGKGKISSVMGDFANGIKAFKSGMKEPEPETAAATPPPAQVTPPGTATSPTGATASTAPAGVGVGGVGDRPRDHA